MKIVGPKACGPIVLNENLMKSNEPVKGLKPNGVDTFTNGIRHGSLVDGPSLNDGPSISHETGISQKECLPVGASSVQHVGQIAAAKGYGPGLDAIASAPKIGPVDGHLNDGPAIREPFGTNSNGGPPVPIRGHEVHKSNNSGGAGKNSWASLFGSTRGFSMTYTPLTTVGEKIVVTPFEEVISQGVRVRENSLVSQLLDAKLSYLVIYRLIEKIWGRIEMPTITLMENGLICFQFKHLKSIEWILSRGPWHLGGKPMLLRKWTPGIVLESFVFDSVHVLIKLGRIPLELWTDAGLAVVASAIGKPLSVDLATKERRRLSYARICVELNVDNIMPAEVTVNLRGEEFIVTVTYEWKPKKCNLCRSFGHSQNTCPKKRGNEDSKKEAASKEVPVKEVVPTKEVVPICGEYEDVVLESFQHMEEGEIITHKLPEKVEVNWEEFTPVDRKNRGMISIWDRGKRAEVSITNSFNNLMEVDKGDKWPLSIVDGSPPPLRVDDSSMVLLSTTGDVIPMGEAAPIRPHG